jgi:tripartite-type tricarboxylate transporter receptor subunit TctC
VPTFTELGLAGFVAPAWTGFLAPAKTPVAIVAKLNATLNVALQDPEVLSMLAQQASVAKGSTPAEFRKQIAADAVRWRKVVEEAKIPRL